MARFWCLKQSFRMVLLRSWRSNLDWTQDIRCVPVPEHRYQLQWVDCEVPWPTSWGGRGRNKLLDWESALPIPQELDGRVVDELATLPAVRLWAWLASCERVYCELLWDSNDTFETPHNSARQQAELRQQHVHVIGRHYWQRRRIHCCIRIGARIHTSTWRCAFGVPDQSE